MRDLKTIKYILFDYDGTLHDSLSIYAPAFKKAYDYLVANGYATPRNWEDHEISKWLGFSSKEMWNNFMPHLPEEAKLYCSTLIGHHMVGAIQTKKAKLYPGALEVLEYLKSNGYTLIFLSNCKIDYMNQHINLFCLDQYFLDFYCTEAFDFMPKYDIFKLIQAKYPGDFIIIGDRSVDIEIATIHKQTAIGCMYGYCMDGELEEAHLTINAITDLKSLL